jgi:FkbM family methyltransferase
MEEKFYGQNKEDLIMSNHIKEKYGQNFIGSIIEIGANDGVTLSNSKYFRDLGWDGFLVEAGRTPFQMLINNINENTKCFNIALGNENSTMKFYESGRQLAQNDVGLVSSLIFDETNRWRVGGVSYIEYDVECLTWESFLSKYDLQNKTFDIISIDIEGMDYDLLTQMDLNHLGCKIVCVEFNGKRKEDYINYMEKFNMSLMYENAENLIFTKK